MAKITEEYLRECRVKFSEALQKESQSRVSDLAKVRALKEQIANCDRLLRTYQKKDSPQ